MYKRLRISYTYEQIVTNDWFTNVAHHFSLRINFNKFFHLLNVTSNNYLTEAFFHEHASKDAILEFP